MCALTPFDSKNQILIADLIGIDPEAAAADLDATFGGDLKVYGLIVTDEGNFSAATFDAITSTSNQYFLQGEDPITWATVYILDEICRGCSVLDITSLVAVLSESF